jgi:tetratricopeptide (TPR) repeat protein
MKQYLIIALAAALLLAACAAPRQKLSPQGNVNLKTANVYYAQQNVEEASKYYTLVLQDNPDHVLALRRMADINLYNGERFADKALELNQEAYRGYDKAIRILEGFTDLKESDQADLRDMKKRRSSAWTRIFKLGETQYDEGNTQAAMEIFEITGKLDPTRLEPLIKLKTIYQKDLKDDAKAEAILRQLYDKDPDNLLLIQEMGIFYINKKDYAAAIPFFEQVKVKEPLNVNNLMNLSYSYFESGNYQKAKESNDLVLNLEPQNPDALTDAKYIAYKLNDNNAALGYLMRLLNLRDNDQDYTEIAALLNEMKMYGDLITYGEKWYAYDETSKLAVQYIVFAAQQVKNKTLETKYTEILKNMQ